MMLSGEITQERVKHLPYMGTAVSPRGLRAVSSVGTSLASRHCTEGRPAAWALQTCTSFPRGLEVVLCIGQISVENSKSIWKAYIEYPHLFCALQMNSWDNWQQELSSFSSLQLSNCSISWKLCWKLEDLSFRNLDSTYSSPGFWAFLLFLMSYPTEMNKQHWQDQSICFISSTELCK